MACTFVRGVVQTSPAAFSVEDQVNRGKEPTKLVFDCAKKASFGTRLI